MIKSGYYSSIYPTFVTDIFVMSKPISFSCELNQSITSDTTPIT